MLARVLLCAALVTIPVLPAGAQNWSFDARKVGMGSPGGADNLATTMIEEESDYRAILLPFGLIQVFSDFDRLNPTNDEFDVVRTIEYAAAPLHYTIGRDRTESGHEFVVDVRNAELSRDLNTYRGFVPANQPPAEGLISTRWGGTIRVHEGAGGSFHGIYLGAGPYVAMRTTVSIDEQLLDVWESPVDVYVANAAFPLANATQGQLAAALTGGYRARFGWPGGGTAPQRDGLYVAANVNYLRGFRYEDVGTLLRLDTDAAGLLTVNTAAGPPLQIRRDTATRGGGASVDLGVGAVVGRWEAGVGVTGIANRIEWRDVERTTYSLGTLFAGDDDFEESDPVALGRRRVELPVDVQGNLTYDAASWTAVGELGHGFQGTSFRAGFEQRWAIIALRGGASYSREMWNPAAGIGFNMGDMGLDVALYANAANAERERLPAIAVSLRLNR